MKLLESKFNDLENSIQKLNELAAKITEGRIIFFEKITLQVKFSGSELCFTTLISWLYALFFEAAGRNLDFAKKKLLSSNVELPEGVKDVQRLVLVLRTILQHNLDLENSQADREKFSYATSWYESQIKRSDPNNAEDYKTCANRIVDDAQAFVNQVLLWLNKVSASEHLDLVVEEWQKINERNFSVYDYEQVLNKVLVSLDLTNYFDSNVLAKKYKDEWKRDIDILPDGFDFDKEAYSIIERFIVSKKIIPLNGKDIIEHLKVSGKQIPSLIEQAQKIFYEAPCNKETLIQQLKQLHET